MFCVYPYLTDYYEMVRTKKLANKRVFSDQGISKNILNIEIGKETPNGCPSISSHISLYMFLRLEKCYNSEEGDNQGIM